MNEEPLTQDCHVQSIIASVSQIVDKGRNQNVTEDCANDNTPLSDTDCRIEIPLTSGHTEVLQSNSTVTDLLRQLEEKN